MAGSIVVTTTDSGAKVTKYSVVWTSDAAGAVSGNSFAMKSGTIVTVEFIPGTGGSQPSDLYDVDLEDAENIPIFDNGGGTSVGSNLSNVNGSHALPMHGLSTFQLFRRWHHGGDVELLVSNAGNAKSGTVNIFVSDGVL